MKKEIVNNKESRRSYLKNKIKKEIQKAYRHKRLIVGIISILLLVAIYLFKDSSSITLRYSTFLGVILVSYLVDHLFDVRLELKHYIFIFLIGVSTLMMSPLYFVYPTYDKLQHFVIPMLLCSIIFFMVNKLKLAMKWKLTFTVLSVVAFLGIFEILEYVLDSFFNWKLQGVYLRDITGLDKFNLLLDPLRDTIFDLSFGILGSSLYAIFAWARHRR
ncbi:MAG: hypothetical protein AABX10_00380 [Nanoarchaeota archaeon]